MPNTSRPSKKSGQYRTAFAYMRCGELAYWPFLGYYKQLTNLDQQ